MQSDQFDRLEFGYYTGRINRRDFIKRSLALGIALPTVMSVASCGEKANEVQAKAANQKELKSEYDYIVVGAGSAGCVIAANLAEQSNSNVLLIEDGNWYEPDEERDPLTIPVSGRSYDGVKTHDYPYSVYGQDLVLSTGRGVGGGSRVNGSQYMRGYKQDFDEWETISGSSKWGYENVLSKYKDLENFDGIINEYHGYEGKLYVNDLATSRSHVNKIISGMDSIGIKFFDDINGEILNGSEGCGYAQALVNGHKRYSVLHSYLYPQLSNENLTIATNKKVTKLLISVNSQCLGLEYLDSDGLKKINVGKELILSAGAMESPTILQRSGVGDRELLESLEVEVKKDLPGVGQNLMDHPHFFYNIYLNNSLPSEGYFISSAAHVKSSPTLEIPDIQFDFIDNMKQESIDEAFPGLGFDATRMLSALIHLNKPVSKGSVQIVSKDSSRKPIVDPNFLGEQEDIDAVISAFKIAVNIFENSFETSEYVTLPDYFGALGLPFPVPQTDDEIFQLYVLPTMGTAWHSCGTCAMGTSEESVVDAELKVHGITNLRVADASVMPTIPRCNTMAPSILIGEMATEFILADAEVS